MFSRELKVKDLDIGIQRLFYIHHQILLEKKI